MLEVRLNGKAIPLNGPCMLSQALESWGHRGRHFAVAVNGDFIPRGKYESYPLKGGEDLEVLSPMQGG